MSQEYDVIVLGTGVVGETVAPKCRAAGLSVAVIDSREYGGTCALRGCNPKKVLVSAAEAVNRIRHLQGNGITGDVKINWPELIEFKRTFTDSITQKTRKQFADDGVAQYHGQPRFTGKNTLQIGDDTLTGKKIVIATGAKPRDLTFPGNDYLTTSEGFMEMLKMPEHVVFVGGGYVSFEFSHVAAIAGARVTILETMSRPLAKFDPDMVNMLLKASRDKGITIHTDMQVSSIALTPNKKLRVYAGEMHEQTFETDLVVHGAGRVPNLDGLELEQAGIEMENGKIVVNDSLQSVSNPSVYVAGDANADGIPLTPVADMEARVVIHNLLQEDQIQPDYTAVPSVVFTSPPLASVGLREDEAKEQGLDYFVNLEETSSYKSTQRTGLKHSGFKVLLEKGTNRILGAHILGHHAEEMINLFALAMKADIPPETIKRTLLVFPTMSHTIKSMLSTG